MSYYFAIIGTQDNPIFEHEFGTSRHGGDGQSRFPEDRRHMNQFIVNSSLDVVEEEMWKGGNMFLKYVDHFHANYVYSFVTGSNVKFMLMFNPDTHPKTSTLLAPPSSITGSDMMSSGNGGKDGNGASGMANHRNTANGMDFSRTSGSGSGSGSALATGQQTPTLTTTTTTTGAGSSPSMTGPTPINNQTGSNMGGSAGAGTGSSMTAASSGVVPRSSGPVITFKPTAPATEEPIKTFFMDVYDSWLKTAMNPFYTINMPIWSPVFRKRVEGAARRYL